MKGEKKFFKRIGERKRNVNTKQSITRGEHRQGQTVTSTAVLVVVVVVHLHVSLGGGGERCCSPLAPRDDTSYRYVERGNERRFLFRSSLAPQLEDENNRKRARTKEKTKKKKKTKKSIK